MLVAVALATVATAVVAAPLAPPRFARADRSATPVATPVAAPVTASTTDGLTGHAWLDAVREQSMREALTATDPLLGAGAFARAAALFAHVDDTGAADAFFDEVARRATLPVVRAFGANARAVRAATRGDFAAAEAGFDALGHPRSLLCVGPFANTGGAGFGSPTPADDVAATIDGPVAGLDRTVRWHVVPRDADGGFDVGARFVARRDVRALCAVVVDLPRAGPVAVRVGSAGSIAVRAGGVTVLSSNRDRFFGFDQDTGVVILPGGRSLVVIEAGFRNRGGVFDVRFSAPDGSPIVIKTSTNAADVKAAAATKAASPSPSTAPLVAARIDDVVADPAAPLPRLRAAIALAQRTQAHDLRDKPPAVQTLLQRLLASTSLSPGERASALVRLSSEREDNDATAARQLLEEALRVDPMSAAAWAGIARLRAGLGDEQGAREAWSDAVRLAPTSATYRNDRLHFERERGLLGAAIDQEILAAARTSRDDALLALAADVLSDRDDPASAAALIARSRDAERRASVQIGALLARFARDPPPTTTATATTTTATATTTTGSKPEAGGDLAELVGLFRLRLRLSAGNHGQAERLLPLLVELDPTGNEATALVEQRRALFPERPEPLQLAARLALIRGDRDAARALLADALALTPEDGDLQRAARALTNVNDDALATRWLPTFDDDALARARNDVPAGGPALGAWVASRSVATRFFDNGLLRSFEDNVVVVHDARKAEGMRAFSFPYSGGRDQVDIIVAERVRRDGRREPAERVFDRGQDGKENGAYSDARAKVVVFSTLDDGDVLHVRVRREATGQQNLFGDFFGDVEVIQGRYPVRRFRYVVEAPIERPLSWAGRGAPDPVVTIGDNVRVYDFVDEDVPGIEGESNMPPWLEVARYLSVSTYASWGDLGRWYEDLIRDQLRLDDELRAVVTRLKGEASDNDDLVRRIYEYVVTQTRYVGIELGIHGWKPYPVTEVHRRRYGDCKDKASLLVVLLREAGIDAHIALVRTSNLGHEGESPPSMWAFNHAIAWVPHLDLFLDGTAERSGWRELPSMDQGALALIVDGDKSRLVTIPVQPADANLNTSDYVLRLVDDGTMVVDGTERFRGHANARERRELADPATQRITLERQLAQSIPGARVERVEVSPLGLDATETGYRFSGVLPARATKQPDGSLSMPLSLYPHDLAGSYADQSTRRFSLWLDHPWRTRNVVRYVLPAGFVALDLPSGGRVDGRFVRFVQTITKTADGFVVDEDASMLTRRVDVADYARFRAEALAADALMKRTLRIVPVGGR
jgi:tetratricopeptide (TPR) repeat protein